ncbi:16S rRNA (uracil(1498)-N(3))-methyltransferase [Granulosicoccus sp. 3-233]|uniref:16S rRNA (uracil(1498)-N(3))-methyltransferase n=1 Tax=Granulosicoccus sp. 3-233 TaxID=3417969 RepID=UPI003D351B2D
MKKSTRSARIARFHHQGELQANSQLTLSKAASHHLVTVLRTRQGDTIEMFNGDGCNYRAIVIDTGQRSAGKCALLELQEARPADTESPVRISLLQGISRGDRMDTSIRQSVELGVNHVQPLYTRQAARALDEKRTAKKLEHWQAILVSACEQSGRAKLATLASPVTLEQWLNELSSGENTHLPEHCYVLDPTATGSLVTHLHELPTDAASVAHEASPGRRPDIGLLIGPESGLDPDEIRMAVEAGLTPVTIGPRILRTETAGPACIGMVQAVLGDLG